MPRISLFAYGTLQPASDTRTARWLQGMALSAVPARVPGRIFAIPGPTGWFPALVPGSSGAVCGTVLALIMPSGALARLDRYEGREYRRVVVRPLSDGDGRNTAQTYLWTCGLPPGAVAIPGGDFLGWLAQTGGRSFSAPRNGI